MIKLNNVSKSYKKYTVHYNTFKSYVLNFFQYKNETKKIETLNVIKDLTLTIKESEVFCISGPNGTGKTTIAKLIAGTIKPTHGVVEVSGRIVPFLELGVAFSNELKAVDNLFLNGVLLGLSINFLRKNKEKIFEFAGIEEFINTPLKYYSSGMQLRLAFSIAMHASGDIYIFDEILAVGDASFQKKCLDAFDELLRAKKTIVIVTHDFDFVKKHATRLLLLNHDGYKIINDASAIRNANSFDEITA